MNITSSTPFEEIKRFFSTELTSEELSIQLLRETCTGTLPQGAVFLIHDLYSPGILSELISYVLLRISIIDVYFGNLSVVVNKTLS